MTLHIAHITEAWNGGIATYVNTLIKHQARAHKVTLFYVPDQARHDFDTALYQSLNIKTIPYHASRHPLKIMMATRAVHKILHEIKPDIVHLHSTFPGLYGRLIKTSCPTVYCAHGWSFVQENGHLKKYIYGGIETILARRGDAIIHISDHESQAAATFGVKSRINVTVPSGIDDIPSPPSVPDFIRDKTKINIGFIGRLDFKKGYDIAVRAFQNLKRRDIDLYVLGDAARDGFGAELSLPANVHKLGWVDNARVPGYIAALDAVLVPSRQEGFGLAAAESLRAGKPAIVSGAGGLPEIIEHEKNGYVFDLARAADELPRLLESLDKQKLKNMGTVARQTYETKFTAERMAREIEAVYKSVL